MAEKTVAQPSELLQVPPKLTTEHLDFLDELREEGITNMFGAVPYLRKAFPTLSSTEASAILSHWMKTFGHRHASEGGARRG